MSGSFALVSIITVRPPAAGYGSPAVCWYGADGSGVGTHTRVVLLACRTSTRVVRSKVRQPVAADGCARARARSPIAIAAAPRPVRMRKSRRFMVSVVGSAPPRRLDLAAPFLRRDPLFARPCARPGRTARFRPPGGVLQQGDQARTRRLAILRLRPVLAAVDQQHAVGGQAAAGERRQALLDVAGQRRRGDVEAQFHGSRDLVDVLAARS